MKCHRILGVRESATENEIEAAFSDKKNSILINPETISSSCMEKKIEELQSAKTRCLDWLSLTSAEKRSARLKEAHDTPTSPTTLYSSGCCSACTSGCCGSDRTCNNCCGSECVSCAGYIDIGIYSLLGIGAVAGLFSLLPKMTRSIRESNERNRQQRRQAAIEENQRLQQDLSVAKTQQRRANDNLTTVSKQFSETILFCNLFETIGCTSCVEIVVAEQKLMDAAQRQISQETENVNRIQERIQKNNQIINQG